MLVEEEKHRRLVHVGDKRVVLLGDEHRLDLNLAVLEEPLEVPVLVLVLVELLEL